MLLLLLLLLQYAMCVLFAAYFAITFTHFLTILYCRYARTLNKYNSLDVELIEQPREILLLIFNTLSAFSNNENNFAA